MKTGSELRLAVPEGTLILRPLHARAVRVRLEPPGASPETPNPALDPALAAACPPAFSTQESAEGVTLQTDRLRVLFDRATGSLTFTTPEGHALLREIPGSRHLHPVTVQGVACHEVEQAFDSPRGERLHGLGQFQDGHAELPSVPRRLIQVNTQIAIPFYLSNRGYGLPWLQAGLTDFNPADTFVPLVKDAVEGPLFSFTVTGSTGAFTDTGRTSTYEGGYRFPPRATTRSTSTMA